MFSTISVVSIHIVHQKSKESFFAIKQTYLIQNSFGCFEKPISFLSMHTENVTEKVQITCIW